MTHSFIQYRAGYKALWDRVKVTKTKAAEKEARAIIASRAQYEGWSVPWFVIGIIHTREAGSPPDFKAVLHNGERIVGTGKKTKLVPKNRGPFSTWKQATTDALRIDHLDEITWDDGWGPEHVAWALEAFNGFGYRSHGIPSPYLWGGTNVQVSGKYVSDGKYDAGTMDPQIGGMALLKELMALDPSVSFSPVPETHPEPAPKAEPPSAPTAPSSAPTEVEPQPSGNSGSKKKTLWGSFTLLLGSVGTYFHQHWKGILISVAVASAIGLIIWLYTKRRASLSPKAIDIEPVPVKAPVSS